MPPNNDQSSSSAAIAALKSRLPGSVRDDPKKALMLTALVVVLLVLWGRMFIGGRGAPQRAAAMSVRTNSGDSVYDSTGRKIRTIESGDEMQKWLESDIPLVVSRNLFNVNLDYFPVDGSRPTQQSRNGGDETFWDQLAKSLSTQADQQEKRANLIQNLRQQAGQLQIASTFMGSKPKVLINGVLLGEGEVVASFRVLKIEPRRLILEREGIRLEVSMQ